MATSFRAKAAIEKYLLSSRAAFLLSTWPSIKYLLPERWFSSGQAKASSSLLQSWIDWANQSPTVLDIVHRCISSAIKEVSKLDFHELDGTFQSTLNLLRQFDSDDSEVADALISYCRDWAPIFAEPEDVVFEGASRSREHWLEFLLCSRSIETMKSIALTIPKFAEHGRTRCVRLLYEFANANSLVVSGVRDISFILQKS
jgi:hypothetical protein